MMDVPQRFDNPPPPMFGVVGFVPFQADVACNAAATPHKKHDKRFKTIQV
jgi:hypothetical protein